MPVPAASIPQPAPADAPVITPADEKPHVKAAAPDTPESAQAKHELAVFISDHVLPACKAQTDMQHAIIRRVCDGMTVVERLTKIGLDQDGPCPDFHSAIGRLYEGIGNLQTTSLEELMGALYDLQNELYTGYCSLAEWLAKEKYLDHRNDKELKPLYINWKMLTDNLEYSYK